MSEPKTAAQIRMEHLSELPIGSTYERKLATLRKLSTPRPLTTGNCGTMDLALESFKTGIRCALKVLDEKNTRPCANMNEQANNEY